MRARAILAEVLGTFLVLFTIVTVSINTVGSPISDLAVALAVVFTVVPLATAFGPISGGHFNPCVTAAMLATGKLSSRRAVAFVASQCFAALAGTYAAIAVLPAGPELIGSIALTPGSGAAVWQALIGEVIASFAFVIVIFLTAVDAKAPKHGALHLGLALGFGILAIRPISGAAINPAVGLSLSIGSGNWSGMLAWLLGPLIGAVAASVVYRVWFEERDHEKKGGPGTA